MYDIKEEWRSAQLEAINTNICTLFDKMQFLKKAFFILTMINLAALVVFGLTGCSTTDREMMEWEGTYDCVVMADKRTFCK